MTSKNNQKSPELEKLLGISKTPKPRRIAKRDAVEKWWNSPPTDPADIVIGSIPNDFKCVLRIEEMGGLRIDGTKDFIDSVLSNLKSSIRSENSQTRLEIQCQEIVDRETKVPTSKWVCYVRVADRGDSKTNVTSAAA
jgi:hypothetical protein